MMVSIVRKAREKYKTAHKGREVTLRGPEPVPVVWNVGGLAECCQPQSKAKRLRHGLRHRSAQHG